MNCWTSSVKSLAFFKLPPFFNKWMGFSSGKDPLKVSLKNLFNKVLSIFSSFDYWPCTEAIDEKWEPKGFEIWTDPLRDYALLELVLVWAADILQEFLFFSMFSIRPIFYMCFGTGVIGTIIPSDKSPKSSSSFSSSSILPSSKGLSF